MAPRLQLLGIRASGDKAHRAGWSRQLPGGDWAARLGWPWTEQGRRGRSRAGGCALVCLRAWVTWRLVAVLGGPSTTCSWWLRGPRLRPACLTLHLRKRSEAAPCLRPRRELDALGSRRPGLELLSRPLPVGLLLALSAFPTSPQPQAAASVRVASWGRSSSCSGFTCTSDRAWAPQQCPRSCRSQLPCSACERFSL